VIIFQVAIYEIKELISLCRIDLPPLDLSLAIAPWRALSMMPYPMCVLMWMTVVHRCLVGIAQLESKLHINMLKEDAG
jgi:hypothetical protein